MHLLGPGALDLMTEIFMELQKNVFALTDVTQMLNIPHLGLILPSSPESYLPVKPTAIASDT